MNIAIDSGPLESGHKVRGVGFYTREFISAIEKERIGLEKINVDAFDFATNKNSLASKRYDIIHCSFFHPYFLTLPAKISGKLVVTIHDLIPMIYKKQYPPGMQGKIRLQIQKQRLKRVSAIITVSETSKKDVVRLLKINPDRVYVVYEGVREGYKAVNDKKLLLRVKNDYKLPEKFVLYVGDINYNKNIPTLISACSKIGINLVIVGKQALDIGDGATDLFALNGPKDWMRFLLDKPHPELAHFESIRDSIKGNSKVSCLGFIPDDDLIAIYNLATVYCQPSYYEGFGLPLLEAMTCKTPSVASKTNALVEISKGRLMYFDPKDVKDLTEKLHMVIRNTKLRNKITEEGSKVAQEYSWKNTAVRTLKIYRDVLGK